MKAGLHGSKHLFCPFSNSFLLQIFLCYNLSLSLFLLLVKNVVETYMVKSQLVSQMCDSFLLINDSYSDLIFIQNTETKPMR